MEIVIEVTKVAIALGGKGAGKELVSWEVRSDSVTFGASYLLEDAVAKVVRDAIFVCQRHSVRHRVMP
ncbi:hypothetical protein [Halorubrum sp. AS12]|uniref:hypothetical protein n=1 Tax=Halorubrum sp. AS12 TaxID=3409687 RepID=UPI003DA71391